MMIKYTHPHFYWIAVLLIWAVAHLSTAQAAMKDYQLEFKPDASTVSLGEPVLINLTVRNTGAVPLHLDFGLEGSSNVTFSVMRVGDIGFVEHTYPVREGIQSIGKVALAMGQSYSSQLILDKWSVSLSPGNYIIRPQIKVMYEFQSSDLSEAVYDDIQLTVTPRSEDRLEKRITYFAQKTNSESYAEQEHAGQVLGHFRDKAAIDALSIMLKSDQHMLVRFAADGLSRLEYIDAVKALLKNRNGPHNSSNTYIDYTLSNILEQTKDAITADLIRSTLKTDIR
jgi:hypothetical protein